MPDPGATDAVLGVTGVSFLGAVYGFIGNAPNALLEDMTKKQIFGNVIFSMGAGSLAPGLAIEHMRASPVMAMAASFGVGFLTFLIVPTVKLLATKVAKNPASLTNGIRGVVDEAFKPEPSDPIVTTKPPP